MARCIDLAFLIHTFQKRTTLLLSENCSRSHYRRAGKPRQLGTIENAPRNARPRQNNDRIHKNKKQRQQKIGSPQKRGARRRLLARCLSRLCELLALINKIPPLPASERAAETASRAHKRRIPARRHRFGRIQHIPAFTHWCSA